MNKNQEIRFVYICLSIELYIQTIYNSVPILGTLF